MNLGAWEAPEQGVSCWILFCHLSVDILEAVSTGRQQKAAGKEAQLSSQLELVRLEEGAAVTSGRGGLAPHCPCSLPGV